METDIERNLTYLVHYDYEFNNHTGSLYHRYSMHNINYTKFRGWLDLSLFVVVLDHIWSELLIFKTSSCLCAQTIYLPPCGACVNMRSLFIWWKFNWNQVVPYNKDSTASSLFSGVNHCLDQLVSQCGTTLESEEYYFFFCFIALANHFL